MSIDNDNTLYWHCNNSILYYNSDKNHKVKTLIRVCNKKLSAT